MISSHGGHLHDERLGEDSDPEEEVSQTSTSVSTSGQQGGRGRAPQQGLQQHASFPVPATGVTDGAPAVVQPTSQDLMVLEERTEVAEGFPPGLSGLQRQMRRSARWALIFLIGVHFGAVLLNLHKKRQFEFFDSHPQYDGN